jgi:integrase
LLVWRAPSRVRVWPKGRLRNSLPLSESTSPAASRGLQIAATRRANSLVCLAVGLSLAEPEPARLDFYSSEEVEALARSLETGLHRDPDAPAVSNAEAIARRAEDRQDGELVRVAAYAGLRRGELVALRWRDVDFVRRKIVVRRAVSANVDTKSTKSRRAREVPLPDHAALALDRLSQRGDFTNPDD